MYQCIPKGICSWDYLIQGDSRHAELHFSWLTEEGQIEIDGVRHVVEKQGMLSGRWLLRTGADKVAMAEKLSVLTHSFLIRPLGGVPGGTVRLDAESAFGRAMKVEGKGVRARIAPTHAFTRRATMTGTIPDFRIACFAVWLTVLIWRRSANSSS